LPELVELVLTSDDRRLFLAAGVILYAHVDPDDRQRLDPAALLDALRRPA
jgi:hypothetical protein